MLRPTCKHILSGLLLISLVLVVFFYYYDGPQSEVVKKRSSQQAIDYSRCQGRRHYWDKDRSKCSPCTFCSDYELENERSIISDECRDKNIDRKRNCSIGPPYYCSVRRGGPTPDPNSPSKYQCIDITTTPNISKQSDAPETSSQPLTPKITSQPPPPRITSQPPIPEHVSQPPTSGHVSNLSTSVSISQQPMTPGTTNGNHDKKKKERKKRIFIGSGTAAGVGLVGFFIVAGIIFCWRKNKKGSTYSPIINNSTTVEGAVDSERVDEGDIRSHRGEYTGGSDAKLTNENDEPQIDAPVGKSLDSGINLGSRTNSVSKNEFQMNRFDNDQNQMPGGDDTDIEDSGNELDVGTQNDSSSPSNSCSSKGTGTPSLNSEILQQHSADIAALKKKTGITDENLAEIEQYMYCFSVNKRLICLISCQPSVIHSLDNPCRCTIKITCLQTECTVLTIPLDNTPFGYSTGDVSPGFTYRVQGHIQTVKGSTDIDLEDTVCVNDTICDMTLEELRNKVNLMDMIMKCEPDLIFMRMFSDVVGVGVNYLDWINGYKHPEHCIPLNEIMEKGYDNPVGVLFYCLLARQKYDVLNNLSSKHDCQCCDQVYREVKVEFKKRMNAH